MTTTGSQDWGLRLSDRIRRALDGGDLGAARRLALEGDGDARSLEKEFTLMVRGLGITIRVLLELLPPVIERAAANGRPGADERARALLARFRDDLTTVARSGRRAPIGTPGPLASHIDATVRVLEESADAFLAAQAELASAVLTALDARDVPRARALVDEKERGRYLPLHDRLVRFMAEVFGFVLLQGGPQALLRFHRATAEGQRRGFEKWEGLSAEEFARASAFLLKQHMGTVAVREDDEKFTIEQTPCGSGGRLRAGGAYEGRGALPMVDSPGALTLGEARFPVYCSHCPIWNGLATIEWFGRPHWVFDEPSRADGSCTLHIYKRRDGAPDDYWRRLGLAPRRP